MRDKHLEPSPTERAFVVLGGDGHFEDASPAALEILGRSLDELKHLSPRVVMSMPDAESSALSEAWKQPGSKRFAGEATAVRPDGTRIRVKFLLMRAAGGRYRAIFEPLAAPATSSFVVYTVPELLAAWRAAERRLADAAIGSREWEALSMEVSRFREQYRVLVDEKTHTFRDPTISEEPLGSEHL